jgi:two-component system NtrC family sensor kinase
VQAAQRNSLRLLRWMMAASLALPLMLFAFTAFLAIRSVSQATNEQIERMLDIAHEHALKVFETIDLSLSRVDEAVAGLTDAEITARQQALHERLEHLVVSLPQMKSACVMDRDGAALVNSLVYPVPKASFADRDYFRAHVQRDVGTYIGGVLTPRLPYRGDPFFSVSRRRRSADGQFNGIVQASVLPNYFEQFYARIGRGEGSFFTLGLLNGTILARLPATGQTPLDRRGGIDQQADEGSANGVATATSEIDGIERRIAWRRIEGYPVYVAAGLETSAIRHRWMAMLGRQLTLALPATAAIFLILWLALRRTKTLYQEEARREAAEAALRRSQRMEALGQLTGGVAHDFNNLLTIIGSSADLLQRPNLPPDRRERYVKAIVETVARAGRLTQQLLAFARRQPLNPQVFDACDCIRSISDIMRTLTGTRIEIIVDLPQAPLYVDVDFGQFEAALINLAANSRDAMDREGTLTLRVRSLDRLPPAVGTDHDAKDWVAIDIVDTGKGIASTELDRVFEPFFTTKDFGKGTGLGLSQVFGFLKQSGGEVGVQSAVGRGTTFTLYLPQVAAPVVAPAVPAPPELVAELVGLHILLVEDNADVGEFAKAALEDGGGRVTFVSRAADALARLDAAPDRYDVVFTDVVMPGMSGIELAKEIRQRFPDMPVVLTSGYSQTLAQEGSHGFDLLPKPYSSDALIAILRRAVGQGVPAHETYQREQA